jgi:hypothetical protein
MRINLPLVALGALLPVLTVIGACSEPAGNQAPEAIITYFDVPAAAGSTAPNLEITETGLAVLSWIEPTEDGHALRFSEFANGAWEEPRTVAEGGNWFVNWADFPSVVPVSDQLWAAHWLVSQPAGGYAYDVNVAISRDAGRTWSAPRLPHSDGTPTEHGFVSIYKHESGIGLIWLDGRNMVNEYDPDVIRDGMTLRGAVYDAAGNIGHEQEIDQLICDCCQTDVAVSADGPVAVYRDRSPEEIRDIYLSRSSGTDWMPGQAVFDDSWEIAACPVNGPAVEARDQQVAVAWFTGVGNVPSVHVAVSEDAGRHFSAPIEIASGDNFGRVGLAMLGDGEVAVSWLRKNPDQSSEMVINRVGVSGEIGPDIVVSQGDDLPGFSFPQVARLDDALLSAWTSKREDATYIRAAIIPIALLQ